MVWFWFISMLAWIAAGVLLGYALGVRRGARIYEGVLQEEREERALASIARGEIRFSRIRITR